MSTSTSSGHGASTSSACVSGNFVRACAAGDVAPESAIAVAVGDYDLAIVNSDGRYYAIADECSHAAVPLSEGDVGEGEIECYLHGSRFDLRTGKPTGFPATQPVAVYACMVEGDDVLVDTSGPLDTQAISAQQQES